MERYDILHSFEHFWRVHVEAWHSHLERLGISKKDLAEADAARPA
mgnify:FL=1